MKILGRALNKSTHKNSFFFIVTDVSTKDVGDGSLLELLYNDDFVICEESVDDKSGFRGGCGGHAPSIFFATTCFFFFCNHFEELRKLLFEVELFHNNAFLTCIYSNTIGTCLTLDHLLFGRWLLCSSNT